MLKNSSDKIIYMPQGCTCFQKESIVQICLLHPAAADTKWSHSDVSCESDSFFLPRLDKCYAIPLHHLPRSVKHLMQSNKGFCTNPTHLHAGVSISGTYM